MQRFAILGRIVATLAITAVVSSSAFAQKHELGLTLGEIVGKDSTSTSGTKISADAGAAWQANYAYRLVNAEVVTLSLGAHFLANPWRDLTSRNNAVPQQLASLYVTPDIVVKIFPRGRIQSWGTVGGGYAQYESSLTLQNGIPNPGKIRRHRGAFVYGGGVDVPVLRFLALRGEIRDFYTGRPSFNIPLSGGQHNVVIGGGFVLRFGK